MNNQKSERFIIEDQRWLLWFFASKNPIVVLIFVTPMLYVIGKNAIQNNISIFQSLVGAILGFLYWSFAEYLIHRFYFHWRPQNKTLYKITGSFHFYHHGTPNDLEVINSGPFTAFLGIFFHGAIIYFLTFFNYPLTLGILFFTVFTYFYYECIHYLVHYKVFKSGPLKYLQEFHLTHHVIASKNYGQITPFWDFLFKTKTANQNVERSEKMLAFIRKKNA